MLISQKATQKTFQKRDEVWGIISGKVVDEKSLQPLPGASVRIIGTNKGTGNGSYGRI